MLVSVSITALLFIGFNGANYTKPIVSFVCVFLHQLHQFRFISLAVKIMSPNIGSCEHLVTCFKGTDDTKYPQVHVLIIFVFFPSFV